MEAKSLLKHPFYQAWNNGKLPRNALVEYAKQYYHFTEHFPRFVAAVFANCTDVKTRRIMIHNLIEEELGDFNKERPHAEQWIGFCEALGLSREEVTKSDQWEKTEAMLKTFEEISKNDFLKGVACLMAYEAQVSDIAITKKKGLLEWYNFSEGPGVEFFDTHAVADIEHSKVWKNILAEAGMSEEKQQEVQKAFNESLDAQWAFLDGITDKCPLEQCACE